MTQRNPNQPLVDALLTQFPTIDHDGCEALAAQIAALVGKAIKDNLQLTAVQLVAKGGRQSELGTALR